MRIEEAKALVTGGSSGIGLETARQLKARGAQVAICGRNEARLRQAAESIGALAIHPPCPPVIPSEVEGSGGVGGAPPVPPGSLD